MGYNMQASTAICTQLKTSYSKIVVPFEDYVKRVKLAGGELPPDPSILNDDGPADLVVQADLDASPKPTNGAESLATPRSDTEGPPARAEMSFVAIDKVRTASDKLNEALDTARAKRAALPARCEHLRN